MSVCTTTQKIYAMFMNAKNAMILQVVFYCLDGAKCVKPAMPTDIYFIQNQVMRIVKFAMSAEAPHNSPWLIQVHGAQINCTAMVLILVL